MKRLSWRRATEGLLVLLISVGIFFRFFNMNWDSGALLHPDEYGLTNTITQLSTPSSIGDYFNTRISPLSPFDKYDLAGEKSKNGPDNRMRWGQLPITLIRLTAEATGQTGYTELRRTGRYISALTDVGTILLLFLFALKLFGKRLLALLAAALYSLSVMPIQQAHFMTSDHFSVFFVMLTLYTASRIARDEVIARSIDGVFKITPQGWRWFGLFGLFLGMAVSCKINQAAVGGVVVLAAFISVAEIRLSVKDDFSRVISLAFILCLFSAVCSLAAFRIFQPMSFRAASGDTSLLTMNFNKDWLDSMLVSMSESSGIGGGPPSEQWAHRLPIVFPLVNMVLYGMGMPLGLMAWAAASAACVSLIRSLRKKTADWQAILIPLVWSVGYFLFMGTRFVKSIRYMLPVYPALCLLAAWGLYMLFRETGGWRRVFPVVLAFFVVGGTLGWSGFFVRTIYGQPHSRVEAVTWIYDNIPAMIQLETQTAPEGESAPLVIQAPSPLIVDRTHPFESGFSVDSNRVLSAVTIAHVGRLEGVSKSTLEISIKNSENALLAQAQVVLSSDETSLMVHLEPLVLLPGEHYWLSIHLLAGEGVQMRRSVLANENWDEGLPFPLYGKNPFGDLYTGVTNEIRWADNESKKEMLIAVLDQADYIILPSQRSLWSAVRIPLTYPMTIRYYQALFDGSLGFELVAHFQRPFIFGNVYFSDLVGMISVGGWPVLPIKNLSIWAAEEAFSVYDHPPVWIYKKTADFSIETVKAILDSVNLADVVVQGPRDAVWPEGYN